MDAVQLRDARIAGLLLAAGTLSFFAGASIPLLTDLGVRVWGASLPQFLELVAAHPTTWLWTNSLFVASIPLTVAGLGLLTVLLREAGERVFATVGLLVFGLGAALWLAVNAASLSATIWAAEEMVRSGAMPAGVELLARWTGDMGFLYLLLAYAATMAYGVAMLQTPLVPAWAGWAWIVFGALGEVSVVSDLPSPLSIPAGVHFMPLLLGIVVLLRRRAPVLQREVDEER